MTFLKKWLGSITLRKICFGKKKRPRASFFFFCIKKKCFDGFKMPATRRLLMCHPPTPVTSSFSSSQLCFDRHFFVSIRLVFSLFLSLPTVNFLSLVNFFIHCIDFMIGCRVAFFSCLLCLFFQSLCLSLLGTCVIFSVSLCLCLFLCLSYSRVSFSSHNFFTLHFLSV